MPRPKSPKRRTCAHATITLHRVFQRTLSNIAYRTFFTRLLMPVLLRFWPWHSAPSLVAL
jgi:hypothetical protein